ncbi:RnfABCDGE type electron transport complex subunit D [Millionella massiliensis]|uniref:RnfABCDGE type electron transport complex subunit D n=1 Tax=Millionella massiliensis TaxID=1871023 RepID=UPI0008D8F32F|nr:RnfABCDGE type electron transport complex subunit D [Millionella massiliensis]
MSNRIVAPSPHLHGELSTPRIMRDVVIALIPAFAFSLFIYGLNALVVTAIAVVSCMLFEWLINRFMLRRASTLGDWSAVVTGTLLAFNLPANISPWLIVLGALVAIGIGKMSFGGLGRNLFNPALVGRVFLLISFPVQMTLFPDTPGVDAITGATPLAFVKEAMKTGTPVADIMPNIDLGGMLLGFKDGSMGEIGALALLIGGIYLLIRKVITWHIPVFVLGSIFVFASILWLIDPAQYMNPLFHLFAGGAMLGAIFMATDYVTSPMSKAGQIIYAIGIGVITILIRVWGAYPEGISFAILIMNATVPLINMYVKPSRFGGRSPKKK